MLKPLLVGTGLAVCIFVESASAFAQLAPVEYATNPTYVAAQRFPYQVAQAPVENRAYQVKSTASVYPDLVVEEAALQAELAQAENQRFVSLFDQPVTQARAQRTAYAPASSYQPRIAPAAPIAGQPPAGYVRAAPGDTVFALARRYNVTPASIIAANEMRAPYPIAIGQAIYIPGLGAQIHGATRQAPQPVATRPVAQQSAYSQNPVATVPQTKRVRVAQPVTKPVTKPVTQPATAAPRAVAEGDSIHVVAAGETLYALARTYKVSVAEIARVNHLSAPYTLNIGQQLVVPGTVVLPVAMPARPSQLDPYATPASPVVAPQQTYPVSYEAQNPVLGQSRFAWPIQGKIVQKFGVSPEGVRNPGINIAAPKGSPVRAAADGEVIYRGENIAGHGNLLLIKHTDGWVSAYAHNDAMLVQQGAIIRKGQIIAKVGTSGIVKQPQLHFELRHEMQPADPLAVLQGRHAKALR